MTGVRLVPMSDAEFADYLERSVADYADEKVASGQWTAETALAQSRDGFFALLPLGLATPHHTLLSLRDAASDLRVGWLWWAEQQRGGRRVAYVYDVIVEPGQRRLGYAARAFRALEAEARSRGLGGIALHVFGHNTAAQALYAGLGFRTTNIDMVKEWPASDDAASPTGPAAERSGP